MIVIILFLFSLNFILSQEKREVESWMLQKRKERMTAYKNEQAAKIKQEARPFVKKNTTTSQPPKYVNHFYNLIL